MFFLKMSIISFGKNFIPTRPKIAPNAYLCIFRVRFMHLLRKGKAARRCLALCGASFHDAPRNSASPNSEMRRWAHCGRVPLESHYF